MAKKRRTGGIYPLVVSLASRIYRLGGSIYDAIETALDRGYRFASEIIRAQWPNIVRREDMLREISETPRGRFISLRKYVPCGDVGKRHHLVVDVSMYDTTTGKNRQVTTTIPVDNVVTVAGIEKAMRDVGFAHALNTLAATGSDVQRYALRGSGGVDSFRLVDIVCM